MGLLSGDVTRSSGVVKPLLREHVADRQAVSHDEDRFLGAREDLPKAAHVAPDRLDPALAAAGRPIERPMRSRPGSVVGQRAALEATEADVVQLRQHEPWDVAPPECEIGGLTRPLELRGGAQVESLAVARAGLELRLVNATSLEATQREARRIGFVRPGERMFVVKGIPEWRRAANKLREDG